MMPAFRQCQCPQFNAYLGMPGRGTLPLCAFCFGIVNPDSGSDWGQRKDSDG